MKNTLIILLSAIVLISCEIRKNNVKKNTINSEISIVEIDKCEYVIFDSYKAGGITHKANCKNH